MHEYYERNKKKLKKGMHALLKHIKPELEANSKKPYDEIFEEIWEHYEKNMIPHFPYIGGDRVSGTKNLTGAYYFVSMGEVLKKYGADTEHAGHLMVLSFERKTKAMPGFVRWIVKKLFNRPKILQKAFLKKDKKNELNAKKNPGSFETKTQIPPESGFSFSFRNLVCPLSNFAKERGYEEYMPYLCNLDYVSLGNMGISLYREKTCFEDGEYCDFKFKKNGEIMKYWPPVFKQGKGYK